jgi:hypothetical protein
MAASKGRPFVLTRDNLGDVVSQRQPNGFFHGYDFQHLPYSSFGKDSVFHPLEINASLVNQAIAVADTILLRLNNFLRRANKIVPS